MVAEWLWYLSGSDRLDLLVKFNKRMSEFSDDGVTLNGAYGPRLMDQLPYVLACLKVDPDSRQAVVSLWKPNPGPSKDIPCTVTLQWLLRDGKLHCVNTMRSSDLWLGLPNDFFAFSQVTSMLAGKLGVQTGSLTMQLGSSHLYETNFNSVVNVLKLEELVNSPTETLRSPLLATWPLLKDLQAVLNLTDKCPFDPVWDAYYSILINCSTKAQALIALRELDLETKKGNRLWSDPR